ncbi:histidine phosphatase family protein [Corynebacterium xerosis]|uniref:histidine phosphatase family protein n=1 Tax=Corynebacterium xerosis TaxID=1725 RepID=UPI00069BE135|nr:histidine phosphatase family protein [Corynebacterium xerosis]SQB96114.1 2,3-bisphosphoglycerate-dependent phosphoglycerate mutase GpmA [Clostridium paraputrificum]
MTMFDGNFAAGEDHSLEESVGRAHRGEDRLILIRHGQTHANIARILDTALPGAPLTDQGIIQARRLGRVLLPSRERMTEIVTSHALRARQTGAGAVAGLHHLVGPGVRLRHEAGLHEVQAGEIEGRSDFDAHRRFMEIFHGWLHGDFGAKVPGGESADDVLARYLPVLRALVAEDSAFPLDDAHASSDSASTRGPADATGSASTRGSADALDSSNSRDGGRNIVVVSHGAAIRLIAQHLANIEGQFIFDNPLPNAARVELVRDVDAGDGDKAGSWKLARWGEKSNEPEAE